MININDNLIKEPTFGTFTRGGEEVQVVNFTLSKGYGEGRECINVQPMAINLKWLMNFQKVISFMYMVTLTNELKKKEENEEEQIMDFFVQAVNNFCTFFTKITVNS